MAETVTSTTTEEVDEPTPINDKLDKLVVEKEQISSSIEQLEKEKDPQTLIEKAKEIANSICTKAALFFGDYTRVREFLQYTLIGGPIPRDKIDELLLELKEKEIELESKKVEAGDEALAELAIQQVKTMKKTWQIVKESCEQIEENKRKIPKIEEKISKMEGQCGQIEKLIKAYNGEYVNDQVRKPLIMDRIKSIYSSVRFEYVEVRSALSSMRLQIDGQLVKLDLMDSQQTDLLVQNAAVSVIVLVQIFTCKGKPGSLVKNIAEGTKNVTQNLQAKGYIKQTKRDLGELREKINNLEKRLSVIKKIKEVAAQFLREHGHEVED